MYHHFLDNVLDPIHILTGKRSDLTLTSSIRRKRMPGKESQP